MYYNKKAKCFYSEDSATDREWLNNAWVSFVQELFKVNSNITQELLKEWKVNISGGRVFIAYPEKYLKSRPILRKERDLRNKLAKQTGEVYEKINKIRAKVK